MASTTSTGRQSRLAWHRSRATCLLPSPRPPATFNLWTTSATLTGAIVNQIEFDKHFKYIFGDSVTAGYGRKLQGAWQASAGTSWGLAAKLGRKNLSECIVNGTDTAFCLGIPSGKINVNSLGHHGTWAIIDPASLPGSVGGKACIAYDIMFSSNFDFKGLDGKLPGLTNAPAKHRRSQRLALRTAAPASSIVVAYSPRGWASRMLAGLRRSVPCG